MTQISKRPINLVYNDLPLVNPCYVLWLHCPLSISMYLIILSFKTRSTWEQSHRSSWISSPARLFCYLLLLCLHFFYFYKLLFMLSFYKLPPSYMRLVKKKCIKRCINSFSSALYWNCDFLCSEPRYTVSTVEGIKCWLWNEKIHKGWKEVFSQNLKKGTSRIFTASFQLRNLNDQTAAADKLSVQPHILFHPSNPHLQQC